MTRRSSGVGLHYLYRAVDKHGKSVGSLLRADRSMHAAQAFFREAVAANKWRWPTKVNLDGNAASHRALRLLGNADPRWKPVVVRCCRYLNNIVEQDHCAIKGRCASMLGLKTFRTAAVTFAGIELANFTRKKQYSLGRGGEDDKLSLKLRWQMALALPPNVGKSYRPDPLAKPPTHQNPQRGAGNSTQNLMPVSL